MVGQSRARVQTQFEVQLFDSHSNSLRLDGLALHELVGDLLHFGLEL